MSDCSATDTYKRLAAPMPTRKRQVPGQPELSYVDVEQVISRLNSVLGVDGWSFAVTDRWYEQDSDCCCVRGMLTVQWDSGRTTHHEDIGGQIINRRRAEPRQALEIANDWKGAQSDCLKRCATQIGVGLFLRTKAQHVSEMPDADHSERDRPRTTAAVATETRAADARAVAQERETGRAVRSPDGDRPTAARPTPIRPSAVAGQADFDIGAAADRLRTIAAKGTRKQDASPEDHAWFAALPGHLERAAAQSDTPLPDRSGVRNWQQGLEWAGAALDALTPF